MITQKLPILISQKKRNIFNLIRESAGTAGKYCAKIFLVTAGQAIIQVQSCDERRTGSFVYRTCTSQDKSLSDLTEKEFGMKVIKISSTQ